MSNGVLQRFFRGKSPFHETRVLWGNGTMPLRVRYFLCDEQAPEHFVTSVRCLVLHHDSVLVLSNRDGIHVMPGGRRQEGETLEQTLRREVSEETGWQVSNISLLGFIHLEHMAPKPPGYAFLHPHFLQIVYRAHASKHVPESMLENDYEEHARFARINKLKDLGIAEAEQEYVRSAIDGK